MTKSELRLVLRKYKKEALACLYPENDWTWGSTKKNRSNTVNLMRKLLSEVPENAWPEDREERVYIKDSNWTLKLFWDEDHKTKFADLSYSKDDHTAWVVKKKGNWVDFDIGGS